MRDTLEMAREAWAKAGEGWVDQNWYLDREKAFKELVELVRADERKIVMNEPLTKEMWQRFEDEIRADEREACAQVCDEASIPHPDETHSDAQWALLKIAVAIRARGRQ